MDNFSGLLLCPEIRNTDQQARTVAADVHGVEARSGGPHLLHSELTQLVHPLIGSALYVKPDSSKYNPTLIALYSPGVSNFLYNSHHAATA